MDPDQRAERQTTHMKNVLDLDDEQLKQVEQANLDMAEKIKEIDDEIFTIRRNRMDAVHAERIKVLEGILNEEQLVKWMEVEKEMRQNRPQGPPKPGQKKQRCNNQGKGNNNQ